MSSHGRGARGRSRWLGWTPILLCLAQLGACSTGAIGVDQCRQIEHLRCEASVTCGVVDDGGVDSCKRFYDDQCLHGIFGEEPSAKQQKDCIALIEDARSTAEQAQGGGGNATDYEKACDVIAEPWVSEQCEYLKVKAAGGASGNK